MGRVMGGGLGLPHCTDLTLQNILKRTAQGSEDEDVATKAFDALKEVSSAPRGLPRTLTYLQMSPRWEPEARLCELGLGGCRR